MFLSASKAYQRGVKNYNFNQLHLTKRKKETNQSTNKTMYCYVLFSIHVKAYCICFNFFSVISLSFLYRRYLTVLLVDMAETALPLQPVGQRATVRQPGDVPHHPDGAG